MNPLKKKIACLVIFLFLRLERRFSQALFFFNPFLSYGVFFMLIQRNPFTGGCQPILDSPRFIRLRFIDFGILFSSLRKIANEKIFDFIIYSLLISIERFVFCRTCQLENIYFLNSLLTSKEINICFKIIN